MIYKIICLSLTAFWKGRQLKTEPQFSSQDSTHTKNQRRFNIQMPENLNATWNTTWNSIFPRNIMDSYRADWLSLTESTVSAPEQVFYWGKRLLYAFYCTNFLAINHLLSNRCSFHGKLQLHSSIFSKSAIKIYSSHNKAIVFFTVSFILVQYVYTPIIIVLIPYHV